MKVKFKKLHVDAVMPTYAHSNDAGLDLVGIDIVKKNNNDLWIDTGLAVEIPDGYVGLVFPRSSITKTDLQLGNSVGVIDSGYRGSIQFRFRYSNKPYDPNDSDWYPSDYKIGDKIGQLIILPYPTIEVIESDELSDSERGTGGFGSTNK